MTTHQTDRKGGQPAMRTPGYQVEVVFLRKEPVEI
jgi:hypothetical protein